MRLKSVLKSKHLYLFYLSLGSGLVATLFLILSFFYDFFDLLVRIFQVLQFVFLTVFALKSPISKKLKFFIVALSLFVVILALTKYFI